MSRIAAQTVAVRLWDNNSRSHVTVDVYIKIDVDRLAAHLGAKAKKNRSGCSVLLDGAIVARVAKLQGEKPNEP
jgi:hypothetical protein